jgi:phosphoesterase RecJ-like protein
MTPVEEKNFINFGGIKKSMTRRNDTRLWQSTAEIAAQLQIPGKQIALTIHVNPDGDAVGSALGLFRVLNKMGHHCRVVSPNGLPAFVSWLPDAGTICRFSDTPGEAKEILQKADIIFALDFNELKRVKEMEPLIKDSVAYKVLIDHHPEPEIFCSCTLSDTSASSTAELVFLFLRETGLIPYVDTETATCLFCGIMTDTGCFSYNSSHRSTWETVATLLDYQIGKDAIYDRVYDNFSAERMRLLGYSLNEKMEVMPQYRTAFIALSKADQVKYSFQTGDSEGFVNYPLSIEGIRFSVLFIEKEGHVRISFRSKGNFAVNVLARKYFHGGGHMNASGGETHMSLEETIALFKRILPEYQHKLMAHE